MDEKTLSEVFEEIKKNDLGFLPPIDAVKEGFLAYLTAVANS